MLALLLVRHDPPPQREVDLAAQVGVAVGTVNWHLKRLAAKGLIKIKRIGRWRWQYLLTPQGIAQKAKLTAAYVKNSMSLYREVRQQALDCFSQVRAAGFERVGLDGEGELLEVCRLTALEQGIKVLPTPRADAPLLRQVGRRLQVEWPEAL